MSPDDEGWMLADPAATLGVGASLAPLLRIGDVIALAGDLGAGKTTLARGLLTALGLAGEAPSPTFAIVQPYGSPELRLPVAHVDLYRIEAPEEVEELGLDDWLEDGALLVEWPERVGARFWPQALALRLAGKQTGGRRLTWTVPDAWKGRWPPPDLP